MGRSILDDLGQEVTGIAAPVSICMALAVILVRVLNPEGESDSGAVYLASVYYREDEGDSTGQKLSGALINALIFVGIITVTTFIMVLLSKYRCTKAIYGYLGFSGFSIFFLLTGIIVVQLLQKAGAHMDWISLCYILLNFALVGSLVLFVTPAPLLLKQCYLIVTGVAVAFVFTWIPEWTTWVLLVAMAIYDILAVLVPGGPLKVLVEMAQERDEDIPALVYEARSVRRNVSQNQRQEQPQQQVEGDGREAAARPLPLPPPPPFQQQQQQQQQDSRVEDVPASSDGCSTPILEAPDTPLIAPNTSLSSDTEVHLQPPLNQAVRAGTHLSPEQVHEAEMHPSEASAFALPEAIKLGLGDFIFYSVLVGRAAMFDMLTVFSCYIAIISGLGMTLVWLAVTHHALPALPISIALAVIFYFVSRFVMEPVILPMTLNLVYF